MDASRNIVIMPDINVREEALSRNDLVTRLCREHDQRNNIILNPDRKRWPHLTLYQFGLPVENISQVETRVAQIAAKIRPLTVTMQGYSLYGNTGIFWLARDLYSSLRYLHELLVNGLNELRAGVVLKQHRDLFASDSGLSIQQRHMLGLWGYPTCFNEYQPHITIGDSIIAPEIIGRLPAEPVEFTVNQIHISTLGPYGTCPDPINTFDLIGE